MEVEYILFVTLGFSLPYISAIFGLGTALGMLAIGVHILPPKEAIVLATVLFSASTLTKTVVYTFTFYQISLRRSL